MQEKEYEDKIEKMEDNSVFGPYASRQQVAGGNPAIGPYVSRQYVQEGNPTGGVDSGPGFCIAWQHGPFRGIGSASKPRTGATVEAVIAAVLRRLDFFQSGKFACVENEKAIEELKSALNFLLMRTTDRETRQVLGKNEK